MSVILPAVLVAFVIASPFIGLGLCCWALTGGDRALELHAEGF